MNAEEILSTCLGNGWIGEEQAENIRALYSRLPGADILNLLLEQNLILREQADALVEIAVQRKTSHTLEWVGEGVETKKSFHNINDYLTYAFQVGASDVHLRCDLPPFLRLNSALHPFHEGAAIITPQEMEQLMQNFLTPVQRTRLSKLGSVEFSYEIPDLARFRANILKQRSGTAAVFRIIHLHVPTMEELGLPEVIYQMTRHPRGLVLITGGLDNGKSTTLAAMVEQINQERHAHIMTLESPIEYIFKPALAQITQREIGTHTESLTKGMHAIFKEDLDVVVISDLNNAAAISEALVAAEAGHLVLATVSTGTVIRTLEGLVNIFPSAKQKQIRNRFSEAVRGVISQELIPRIDIPGRAMALEIMINTPAVANVIREGNWFMLQNLMQFGNKHGMCLMDESLQLLAKYGFISTEEAYQRSQNKEVLARYVNMLALL